MVFLPTLQIVHPHRLHRKSAATPNAESADGKDTRLLPIRLLLYVPPNLQGPDHLFKKSSNYYVREKVE